MLEETAKHAAATTRAVRVTGELSGRGNAVRSWVRAVDDMPGGERSCGDIRDMSPLIERLAQCT